MRRVATAVVPLALALLLVTPFVRGAVFIAVLAALTITIFVLVGRRIRRSGASPIPWVVSLGVSAVVTTPQIALGHYKHAAGAVFGGVFWWLILAALLRLVIFLADYLRSRNNGSVAKPS